MLAVTYIGMSYILMTTLHHQEEKSINSQVLIFICNINYLFEHIILYTHKNTKNPLNSETSPNKLLIVQTITQCNTKMLRKSMSTMASTIKDIHLKMERHILASKNLPLAIIMHFVACAGWPLVCHMEVSHGDLKRHVHFN